MTEALAKLSSGKVNFDVFMGVTNDVIGKTVAQKLIQPLNHSYIPNIGQTWREYTSPFYDQQLAVHGAVHDLHDRHLLAQGSRPRGSRLVAERVRVPVAVQVRGQGRDPGRLPRVDPAWR